MNPFGQDVEIPEAVEEIAQQQEVFICEVGLGKPSGYEILKGTTNFDFALSIQLPGESSPIAFSKQEITTYQKKYVNKTKVTEISRGVYDAIMMVGMPGIDAFPGFGNAGNNVFSEFTGASSKESPLGDETDFKGKSPKLSESKGDKKALIKGKEYNLPVFQKFYIPIILVLPRQLRIYWRGKLMKKLKQCYVN